jgi:hypothetical protein
MGVVGMHDFRMFFRGMDGWVGGCIFLFVRSWTWDLDLERGLINCVGFGMTERIAIDHRLHEWRSCVMCRIYLFVFQLLQK